MRVEELLSEEAINAGKEAKAMSLEFKELANRFKLSLIAGMGWPQVVKDGAWMGGGMGPLRGIDDEKVGVSIEKRRLAFIAAVAKKLEDYLAEGRVVKLAKGGQRSRWNEPAVAGKVKEQMLALIVEEQPPSTDPRRVDKLPTIVWFVGLKPGQAVTRLVSVTVSVSGSQEAGRSVDVDGEEIFYPPWQFASIYGTFELQPDEVELLKDIRRLNTRLSKGRALIARFAHDFLLTAVEVFGADGSNSALGKVRLPGVVRDGKVSLEDFLKEVAGFLASREGVKEPGAGASVSFTPQKIFSRNQEPIPITPFIPIIRKYADA